MNANYTNLMNYAEMALREISGCSHLNKNGHILRKGTDLTILTTEQTAVQALLAAKRLHQECVEAKVISINTDRIDRALLLEACRTGMVFVVDGGEMTQRCRSTIEEAFETHVPFLYRTIQLKAFVAGGQRLRERYESDAAEIYNQVVNAA